MATMTRKAEIEPLVATIEIRRNTGPHELSCCYRDEDGNSDPHRPAPLLVIVRGKWMGAASCSDSLHLGGVIRDAIEQAGVDFGGL